MSFGNDYLELLKKKQKEIDGEGRLLDIAPVGSNNRVPLESDIAPTEDTWFKSSSLFDDGYDVGDVSRTILSSTGDLLENATGGLLEIGEGVVDAGAYVVGGVADIFGADDFSDNVKDFIADDLYDGVGFVKGIGDAIDFLDVFDTEEQSIFGTKSDSLAQSAGQLAGVAALQAVGVPAWVTMGVTSFGGEVENAFNQGATYGQAGLSGIITAGAEILTERISGGISFGGKTLDSALTKQLAVGISNKTARTITKIVGDTVGEGFEEILSGALSAVGQQLTYNKGKDFNEIFSSEDAFDSFIGGAVLGFGSSSINAVKSANKGVDATTGLTKNEETVFNKVYEAELKAEAEKKGKDLTKNEKDKIYDRVLKDLERGQISTDTIEEVLGGEDYNSYKNELKRQEDIDKELNELRNMKSGDMTDIQTERMNELKGMKPNTEMMESLKFSVDENIRNALETDKTNLKDSRNSFLTESYNEKARRGQAFEADLSKYDSKQAEIVKKAIDSGILNNTNRTHEFVDMVAKISADKGVSFDFTNNEKLKESGFAIDGKYVNGYVTKDGITVNMNSAKALDSVVGHEITHVLEGTELYNELQSAIFEYSKTKGDYQKRLDTLKKLYEGVEGADINAELTADLVGDYLFTDEDFVRHLSTSNRNVFEKIFDEIKYLYKMATAGSKEARRLEEVKHTFEKVWREGEQKNTTKESGTIKTMEGGSVTKYSLSTWTPETQAKVKENLIKSGFDSEQVDKWIKDTNSIASVIAADKDRLDFEAADNQVMLKDNQEYVKTLDASTLCAKRLVYQGTFDAIQHRMPNQVLSSDDLIDLLNMMKEHGVQTPCGVCYVESRRRHLGKFAQGWLDTYNGEYKPNLDEVTTSDGLEALRKSHPQTYKDFVDAMNKKGSSNPKVVQLRTEYRNEIMKLTPKQIKAIESIGGLRVQSFSDFETPHMLDMMQAVMDMSAKGLHSQAYTKVPNFAWVFGDTGIKINLSLIAEGDGFDADGNLAFSSTEGMDINEAMKLRDAYSQNVGTIIVGANDAHILACMADDRIDFIIPFHRSGWGMKELEMMGMSSYTDYTYGQKEHDLATGKGIANLYPADYWDYTVSGKENAERYLNLCAKTGREPKFSKFLVNNGDGSYSLQPDGSTDGYWKTLIDFKMYDNEGNGASQQKVQPNFNMTEAYRVLDEYEGGANKLPVANDVVDEFVAKYQSTHDIAPTDYSLSQEGETSKGRFFGKDMLLDAPMGVAENTTTTSSPKVDNISDETAPVVEDVPVEEDVPNKEDRLEREFTRINNRLADDRVALDNEFEQKKQQLQSQVADKNAFVSTRAYDLYKEISNLKKGVRASKELGYILDHGFEWKSIKSALINAKNSPNKTVNPNSSAESIVRELLNEEYESKVYELDELDTEYQERINELEKSAEKERAEARKKEQRVLRSQVHQSIVDNVKAQFSKNGYDFDSVLKKAKNLSTFSTVDNTPQRVMEKALGYKEGQILADETVNKVAQNETEGIKWLNSYTDRQNGLLAQISKQYNIKPNSKESAAAQMYAEGFYVNDKNEIIKYGDSELAKDFPDARVQANIKGLAKDTRIREIYDETLDMINASRTRNAYPEIQKLDNYFLHFRAMDDTFSRLGLPFNPNDIRAKDLPTDLNGVTADLKPGQPYFASAMHRKGHKTSYDLLGGLERYLSSAKNQIYHIDDIQTLRALRNYIADTYGQANGLEGLDALAEEEVQERIEQVFGSHLSTFAKFLNEEANILAGKTALIDRGLEGIIGRRGITFLDTINKQVGANMVGFNVSSSLTNFLAPVQAFAKTNKTAFVKGFTQTVSNRLNSIVGKSDGFAENSPVVIRRKGADRFHRTPFQKVGDAGYVLMGAVDNISTEIIARAKYNELTAKGMDSETAHIETDKWVSRLMGDRSLGQMPQLYNSKMLGLITKFQLEVRNQLDSQFYDTIQEAKADNATIEDNLARNSKTAAKVTSTFVQLAVAQHLFGKAFEAIAGYNPAFDIISVIATALGLDDDEESEDTALDNIEQGFLALLEDLPYTSTFTGGRIPISSALPIEELVTGKDEYGNEVNRMKTLGEVAPYYVLPGGYGQLKKTIQGLSMFSDDHSIAGSYTDKGNLRFPVDDTLLNRVQAGVFGQYASQNARDYFDNDIAPLNENQTQEFIDVNKTGMSIQDYWKYRKGMSGLTTLAEKADYINSLDLTDEQKNILINNVADRKEAIDMSDYGNYGSFEEFDFANKYPTKYAIAQSVGGYDAYKTYSSELGDITSDKDANGKTISGSRKTKVMAYIESLDLDYGQKIILHKSEYPSDNTYNYDICEYLNSRDDISWEQMKTILTELGFKVDPKGNITWD